MKKAPPNSAIAPSPSSGVPVLTAPAPGPATVTATGTPESLSQTDVADYVAEITCELARLARSSGLNLVAFLLEMSAEEAKRHQGSLQPP